MKLPETGLRGRMRSLLVVGRQKHYKSGLRAVTLAAMRSQLYSVFLSALEVLVSCGIPSSYPFRCLAGPADASTLPIDGAARRQGRGPHARRRRKYEAAASESYKGSSYFYHRAATGEDKVSDRAKTIHTLPW